MSLKTPNLFDVPKDRPTAKELDRNRVQDRYYDGQDYQSAADYELRAQRPRREENQEENQNE